MAPGDPAEAQEADVSSPSAVAPSTAYRELFKLKETKLFKVINIYSRLTGVNVFVDDTVRDKPITLSVTDLPIERVLDLILLTNSLQKKAVGPNSVVIFPPAKEDVYKGRMRSTVFQLGHKHPQEMIGLLKLSFPKTAMVADDKSGALVVIDEDKTLSQIAKLIPKLDRKDLPIEREVFLLKHLDPALAVPYVQGICPTAKTYADERIRTLTIYAPPASLVDIRSILARLDHPPAQVSVEVKLLDIDRTSARDLGISLTQDAFTPGDIANYRVKNLPLRLSALLSSDKTKVLAAPSLQLLNQKKASILIGDKIPLELKTAAQTAQGSINLATNVQYTNVGIQLDVEVLNIHSTGEVTLSLVFDVSSVVNFTPSGFPRTSSRTANTVLRLKNGETIVLGGLLNDTEQVSLDKIPIAGDLPIIGGLFRRKSKDLLTREIVMTVTPRLIVEPGFVPREEATAASPATAGASEVRETTPAVELPSGKAGRYRDLLKEKGLK